MTIYHGSNVVVSTPRILTDGYYKDFGYGVYCTNLEKQAVRWALTRRNNHVVNHYSYEPDNALRILRFRIMTDEWLDFIADCRRGTEHAYDIVEGPMANDTIWDYVEDFARGSISRAAFWELAKFRYPTHQITFCTERALKTLQYTGAYKL